MARKNKINTIQNVSKSLPKSNDIRKTITAPTQVYRVRTDILKWRNALSSAQSLTSPQRFELYQLFQEFVLDAHLTAAIIQRKNLTLSKEFCVFDKADNEVEDKSYLLKKKWFRDLLNHALDSIFYGYSLVQFEDLYNDEFKCVDLVPRIYVKPEFHIVTNSYADVNGVDYLENPYKNWCIGIGDPLDLGLLNKAAPLLIWKKNALAAWAEYNEIFGSPIRIGKTDVRDIATSTNMENMLKNMSGAAYGMFDLSDEIELIESGKSGGQEVFDKMIDRCNSEISKLILGQTSTLDEKAFVGSAEVHERVLKQIADADEYFITSIINYQLIPLMNGLGMGFEGLNIKVEQEDEFTLQEKAKFAIDIINTGKYEMDVEVIKEVFGAEVIKVAQVDTGLTKMKNSMDEYYGS
jgi:hypothetical protein